MSYFHNRSVFLPIALAGLWLSACHSSTPAAPVVVTNVVITGTVPALGSTAQFTCTATFSDGSTQDVSGTATWVSFNPAVATVSSSGVVSAVASGTSVLQATYQGIAAAYNLTVTSPSAISSVAVTGAVPPIGRTAQFRCIVTFSDGTTQDVTNSAAWVSFTPSVATVSSTGVVTARGTGTSIIKATYQGNAGTFSLTVTQ